MNILGKKADGVFLLFLAGLFFWFPYYLKQPGDAHHKILVATEKLQDGVFDQTVVLILRHNGYSALGFVLNKPLQEEENRNFGGPVNVDAYYSLHSFDVSVPGTILVPELQVGYTNGEVFSESDTPASGEYIVLKGVSSWGRGQLSREIGHKKWKVIDFDRDLVFHTDPQKMWDIAVNRPVAQKSDSALTKKVKNISKSGRSI